MNRACDNQFQECQLAANTDDAAGFAVGDCDAQNSELSRFASNSLPRLSPPLHPLAPQKQKKKAENNGSIPTRLPVFCGEGLRCVLFCACGLGLR